MAASFPNSFFANLIKAAQLSLDGLAMGNFEALHPAAQPEES
jgi:hypothetical protein